VLIDLRGEIAPYIDAMATAARSAHNGVATGATVTRRVPSVGRQLGP
jgi:hypothetical protein